MARKIKVKYNRIDRFCELMKIECDYSGRFYGKYNGYKTWNPNGNGMIFTVTSLTR